MAKNNILFNKIQELAQMFSPEKTTNIVHTAGENIFGFYSPSGGNGCTTLVANVALALSTTKKKIAVVDMDLLHPQLFRFLSQEQEEPPISMNERWLDTTKLLPEFAAQSEDGYISIFSARLDVDVYDLSNIRISAIKKMISDLGDIYDYVLIDISDNLNNETTFACTESCSEIFTLIRPTLADLEAIYKDNLIANKYKMGSRFRNIVQTPVRNLSLKEADFQEIEDIEFKQIANIPYVDSAAILGQNNDCLINSDVGADIPSEQYRTVVRHLAEIIVNYTAEEDISVDTQEHLTQQEEEEVEE